MRIYINIYYIIFFSNIHSLPRDLIFSIFIARYATLANNPLHILGKKYYDNFELLEKYFRLFVRILKILQLNISCAWSWGLIQILAIANIQIFATVFVLVPRAHNWNNSPHKRYEHEVDKAFLRWHRCRSFWSKFSFPSDTKPGIIISW